MAERKIKIDVIEKRNIYFFISGTLIILAFLSLILFNLNLGIDLIGGTNWQLSFQKEISEAELKNFLSQELGLTNYYLRKIENVFNLKILPIDEEKHQLYFEKLKNKFGDVREISFSSIGPTIGAELRNKAMWAALLVLFGISFYIAFVFRKSSKLIKSYKFGLVTLITLFHDAFIAFGFLVFLGYLKGVEISVSMIVSLLLVIGFSVHDTIVVFDRIRENITNYKNKFNLDLKEIINFSVNETLARSINTSLTFIFVLIALMILGPMDLYYFCLVTLIGTLVGTYSSIFIASPLFYLWAKKDLQK